MSDVEETLRDLLLRRLRELGRKQGGDEPLTLHDWHQTQVESDGAGRPLVSYETFRQIYTGEHSGRISDATARVMADALDVSVDEVYAAAGQRPRLGAFTLPGRADQLDDKQRRVVLSVVDAILAASQSAAEGSASVTHIHGGEQTTKRTAARKRAGKPKMGDE